MLQKNVVLLLSCYQINNMLSVGLPMEFIENIIYTYYYKMCRYKTYRTFNQKRHIFRPNRWCFEHVLVTTSYLEKGAISGAAFIDLSAAHDTIWKHGLLLKLSGITPSKLLLKFLKSSLGNRNYRAFLGDRTSKKHVLNNEHSQRSVLAPVLLIYTHTISQKRLPKNSYTPTISA